jgi:AP-3 complex subunit beta
MWKTHLTVCDTVVVAQVHALDHTMRDQLLEMIESMLGDRTPIVIASAVAAFLAVCPERLDLLHKHYRKLCRMMVDVEEWGQALMAPLLLRYARTQFCRPDNHARELTAEEEVSSRERTMSLPDRERESASMCV